MALKDLMDPVSAFNGLKASPLHVQIAYALLAVLLVIGRAKVALWTRGIIAFVLWGEKKGMKKHKDSEYVEAPKGGELEQKIIVFIRHGESDWNYIFNESKILLLPRLIMGIIYEACMFVFKNSTFIDSPLSLKGVEQAKQLQRFIDENKRADRESRCVFEVMKALRGDAGAMESVLVTSPLRRAIATGCIAMYPRMQRNKETILVHSALQEMSRNVDTMALAGPRQLPETSVVREALGNDFRAKTYLDVSQYTGNKKLKSKAMQRMDDFCAWCFQRPEPVIIVAAGHSLWNKNFFEIYLPKSVSHPARTQKMLNCGVVAFNLEKGVMKFDSTVTGYRVIPNSVTPVYLGFEKAKMMTEVSDTRMVLPRGKTTARSKTNGKETNGNHGENGKDSGSVMTCCSSR